MAGRVTGETPIWQILNVLLPPSPERRRVGESVVPPLVPHEVFQRTQVITPDNPVRPRLDPKEQERQEQELIEFLEKTVEEAFGKQTTS